MEPMSRAQLEDALSQARTLGYVIGPAPIDPASDKPPFAVTAAVTVLTFANRHGTQSPHVTAAASAACRILTSYLDGIAADIETSAAAQRPR